MNEANRLRNLARVEFAGVGDEPKKLFFHLVKVKRQWETMPILITKEGNTLEHEGKILEEVERFYGKLCTLSGISQGILEAREELLSVVRLCITHTTAGDRSSPNWRQNKKNPEEAFQIQSAWT